MAQSLPFPTIFLTAIENVFNKYIFPVGDVDCYPLSDILHAVISDQKFHFSCKIAFKLASMRLTNGSEIVTVDDAAKAVTCRHDYIRSWFASDSSLRNFTQSTLF